LIEQGKKKDSKDSDDRWKRKLMNKSRKGTEYEHTQKLNLRFSLRKRKKKMNEKRNKGGMRKLDFLEKMQRKILQGGYQICSDTMLGNMASIDEGEKNLTNFVLMNMKMLQ
jgi:hypothetical protein